METATIQTEHPSPSSEEPLSAQELHQRRMRLIAQLESILNELYAPRTEYSKELYRWLARVKSIHRKFIEHLRVIDEGLEDAAIERMAKKLNGEPVPLTPNEELEKYRQSLEQYEAYLKQRQNQYSYPLQSPTWGGNFYSTSGVGTLQGVSPGSGAITTANSTGSAETTSVDKSTWVETLKRKFGG